MDKDIFCLDNYNYSISQELIAQEPFYPRDACRLLAINRKVKTIDEGIFKDILNFFKKGDVLVLNDTKVIKARLCGKKETGGKVEVLLLKEKNPGIWEALVNPGKRLKINDKIVFEENKMFAKIIGKTHQATRILQFTPVDFKQTLDQEGEVPLPPYIKQNVKDLSEYQTIYAQKDGSVAAPTAGLHFTKELLRKIKEKGVRVVYLTLHCGLATFRPVKCADIRNHDMDSEYLSISKNVADEINAAKNNGGKVIAVGTTAIRALESSAVKGSGLTFEVKPFSRETDYYIVPGYKFKVVDMVITNFHTPCSTNLILMATFCGLKLINKSYQVAQERKFRFFSFGDAMIII